MSIALGTLIITSGQKTNFSAPNEGVKAIRIGCESGLHVTITMESGGVQKTLYPGMVDWFDVRSGFTGTIIVQPTTILNNASTFPSTSLVFDAIGLNDTDTASQYPVTLTRNTNIGNAINTVLGTASAVQNDGAASGTSIVESTVLGDSSSAASLTNNGHLSLGTTANDGFFQLVTAAGAKTVKIDTTGALTVDKGIIANLITAQNLNDIGLHVQTGNRVVDTVNGVDIFQVNSAGATLLAGTFALLLGSLARISKFSGTANTTPAFFNHGLGAVPDIVMIVGNGTSATVHSFFVDYASLTNTQAKITNDSAGGTPFVALAIKF